jgi:hypothetical protein
MPLYVESPDASYPPAVVEGALTEDGTGIVVNSPEAIRMSWRTLSTLHFVRVSDSAGPARMLGSREELEQVLRLNRL